MDQRSDRKDTGPGVFRRGETGTPGKRSASQAQRYPSDRACGADVVDGSGLGRKRYDSGSVPDDPVGRKGAPDGIY